MMKKHTRVRAQLISLMADLSKEEVDFYDYVYFKKAYLTFFYFYNENRLLVRDCRGTYSFHDFYLKEEQK